MRILVKLAPAAIRRWKSVNERLATVSIVPIEVAPEEFVAVRNRAVRVIQLFDGWESEDLTPAALRIEVVMPGGTRLERVASLAPGGAVREVILGERIEQPWNRRRIASDQRFTSFSVPRAYRARESIGSHAAESLTSLVPVIASEGLITDDELQSLGLGVGFVERSIAVRDAARLYHESVASISTTGPAELTREANTVGILPGHRRGVIARGWWASVEFVAQADSDVFEASQRRFAVMDAGTTSYIVPMMGRTRYDSDDGLRLKVRARIRLPEGKAIDPTVEVLGNDPMMSSILDLLQHGEVAAAKGVLDTASKLLFRKFDNPYLAALGAHVLLGFGEIREDVEWHRWVQNLALHFGHVPDGVIVLAALVLRRAAGLREGYHDLSVPQAVKRAKQLCARAIESGPPHFVVSIRLLGETLSLIASYERNHKSKRGSDSIPRSTEELLQSVQWLGARTDTAQGFTVIKLDSQELALEQSIH